MITVMELASSVGLIPLYVADGNRTVTGGYAGDLLSWVMGRAKEGDAWVTIMSNVNVSAVAQLADVALVVFAEGVVPDNSALDAAKLHGINFFVSNLSSFELCALISRQLAAGGR